MGAEPTIVPQIKQNVNKTLNRSISNEILKPVSCFLSDIENISILLQHRCHNQSDGAHAGNSSLLGSFRPIKSFCLSQVSVKQSTLKLLSMIISFTITALGASDLLFRSPSFKKSFVHLFSIFLV